MEGHPHCAFCEQTDNGPKTTFDCGHIVHTACFMIRIPMDFVRCPTCATLVYEHVAYPANPNADAELEEIRTMYTENRGFSANVFGYVRSLREQKKAETVMKQFMKERRSLYEEELRIMKERLQEIRTAEVKRLRESPQHKTLQKLQRKTEQLLQTLHPTKHYSYRTLRRALKGKKGLKMWPLRGRFRNNRKFIRYFYFRITV